jgi:hypothetical protein
MQAINNKQKAASAAVRLLTCAGMALALSMVTAPAQAQARYTCRLPNGSVTISDRPCGSSSPGLVYYGPTEQRSAPSSIPKAAEAPEHLKYMSARCASMSDAVRTAGVRGLKHEASAELQRNYYKECGDNERDAQAQLYAERRGLVVAKQQEKMADAHRQRQGQLQQQQCDESRRILATKRKRTDLSDGEKADLLRFEENFRARCG